MSALSSKRTMVAAPSSEVTFGGKGISVVAFVASLICLYFSFRFDSSILAGLGFIGFTVPLMYWNAMFWARVWKDKRPPYRHYPYL